MTAVRILFLPPANNYFFTTNNSGTSPSAAKRAKPGAFQFWVPHPKDRRSKAIPPGITKSRRKPSAHNAAKKPRSRSAPLKADRSFAEIVFETKDTPPALEPGLLGKTASARLLLFLRVAGFSLRGMPVRCGIDCRLLVVLVLHEQRFNLP